MANSKLGKAAGFRIASAALVNASTALAALGYGGVKLMQSVGASASADTSTLTVVAMVMLGMLAAWTMVLGLVGMCHAGTDKLRAEERRAKMNRRKQGASKV